MNSALRLVIPLNASPDQAKRLGALQSAFALACNDIAEVVKQTRCWNRVALHHMTYKPMRERHPALGSQMVCNAIYSVSRMSRLLFQTPGSPLHHTKLAGKDLPLLRFDASCPVYFDRHTLSLKGPQLSMFTLDGRMRFELQLRPADEQAFHERKLKELVLSRTAHSGFELSFWFGESEPDEVLSATWSGTNQTLPHYVSLV